MTTAEEVAATGAAISVATDGVTGGMDIAATAGAADKTTDGASDDVAGGPPKDDAFFMDLALAEAAAAAASGEVPVGAVIVLGGRVIARAGNRPIGFKDPTAHAEILAIREAARRIDNYRLLGTTLYATLEPCPMCAGAMIQARVKRLVFGARDPKAGAVVSAARMFDDYPGNHRVEYLGGVREERCAEILSSFFMQKRL